MSLKKSQPSNAYKISQSVFVQEEIRFKTLEIDKVCAQLNKMKNDLRTVVSFFDWSHITNTFADSNIKIIQRLKEVQDYKNAELLASTLTYYPKEIIYNFSS